MNKKSYMGYQVKPEILISTVNTKFRNIAELIEISDLYTRRTSDSVVKYRKTSPLVKRTLISRKKYHKVFPFLLSVI